MITKEERDENTHHNGWGKKQGVVVEIRADLGTLGESRHSVGRLAVAADVVELREGAVDVVDSHGRDTVVEEAKCYVAGVDEHQKEVDQKRVVIHVVTQAHAVVGEGTVVTHHLNARMAPTTVVSPRTSHAVAFRTHLVHSHEIPIANVFLATWWISRGDNHRRQVVKHCVREQEHCTADVSPSLDRVERFLHVVWEVNREEQRNHQGKAERWRQNLHISDGFLRRKDISDLWAEPR